MSEPKSNDDDAMYNIEMGVGPEADPCHVDRVPEQGIVSGEGEKNEVGAAQVDRAEQETIEAETEDDRGENESRKNFCYVLINDCDNKTYNGFTNNPCRRIRQHNGDIKGGAKFTTRSRKKDGLVPRQWEYLLLVESAGMSQTKALSLEWHIKYPTCRRPRPRCYNGACGRIASLVLALSHRKFSGMNFVVNVTQRYLEKARKEFDTAQSRELLSHNGVTVDVRGFTDVGSLLT